MTKIIKVNFSLSLKKHICIYICVCVYMYLCVCICLSTVSTTGHYVCMSALYRCVFIFMYIYALLPIFFFILFYI